MIKFVAALLATLSLTYILHHPIPNGGTDIPALGKLLNPFTGCWQNGENADAHTDQTIDVSGLSGEVKVVYDDRLVPHIFADNLTDAAYVQGYILAQHRLWQMDISTRATVGRLAEVMGDGVIERDKIQRRLGLGWAAENAVNTWKNDAEVYGMLEAYRDGINAYMAQLKPKDYPIEFKLLNYAPEPWTIMKTAIFVKSMATTLCFREDDLESTNALNHFGKETFDFLYPTYNPKVSPIVPAGTEWDFKADMTQAIQTTVPKGDFGSRPYEKPEPFIGSNNWAVSGSKTASGNAILCNDPHLSLTLPSIWFEVQITTPEVNSYGVALPGLPGIIIGFNEDIAWGQTNVGQDVTDWYAIRWADDTKEAYILDGIATPVEYRLEEIKCQDGSIIIDSVKYTHWGPVVYESDEDGHEDMALQWLPHTQNSAEELRTFTGLLRAKNYNDYSEALKNYISPAQNFVFASREGDIAIKVNGRLPIKRDISHGRFVQDGSISDNAWLGYIPMEQVAQVKNPERGFVSSANQHSTDESYPYPYIGGFDDYRGRILNRKLEAMNDITIDDMMELQMDSYSILAEELLPLLLSSMEGKTVSAQGKEILSVLKTWDYNYKGDEVAPTYFQQWYREFYRSTWDEIYTWSEKEELEVLYPETWRTIALFEDDADNIFFDNQTTTNKETAIEIAQMAFDSTVAVIEKAITANKPLEWYKIRNTKVGHLGRIPAFGSGVITSNGVGDALNALSSTTGPSWRMIVEMGDKVEAYGVYPGGQSGNPGSPYYKNMLQDWTDGKYNKLQFIKTPEQLGDATLSTQTFN